MGGGGVTESVEKVNGWRGRAGSCPGLSGDWNFSSE